MKGLILAAGIATSAVPLSAANGAILTVGGALSHLCYESALSRDDRASASEVCTRALNEEALARPDRAATYVNRGILNMIRGHRNDADADFDAALALDQGLSDAWLNKGFLRLREGKGEDALPLLQKGIDHGARRQALAIFARGVAYEQMGQYNSAYADLRRARALEPKWALPGEWLAHYQVNR